MQVPSSRRAAGIFDPSTSVFEAGEGGFVGIVGLQYLRHAVLASQLFEHIAAQELSTTSRAR